jgi:C-terminal processing protease CtpA/Prc
MVNDYILTRNEFSLFKYHINVLRPQNSLNVLLIKPSGNKYKVEIKSKVTQENVFLPSSRDLYLEVERNYNERTKQLFNDETPGLAIWKMPNFRLSDIKLEKMMDRVEKNNSLILDLRGNPGGYVATMLQLASHFFAEEVIVGTVKERDGLKEMRLKPQNKNPFKGKVVILIDSASASGSEAFARLMQIEKRATIIGDQSAGHLTMAITFYHTFGIDSRIPYGLSVTVAEMYMKDGQRLEKVGVTPDEKLLPSAKDLAGRRDPVLARAAEILGFQMTAEQAGLVFAEEKK